MHNVKVSAEFYNDLSDTIIYISNILNNVDAAISLYNRVNDAFDEIAKNPAIYTLLKSKQVFEFEYRYVYVGNYYLIFHYDDENVYVARLIYSKRDFDNITL